MDTVHREVLDVHHDRLVTSLRANDVIDRLLKENAISKYDYDQLKRTEAQGTRAMNRLLILTLRRRGGEAFPAFERSLLDSQQKELHDVLKSYELGLLEAVLAAQNLRRSHDFSSSRLPSDREPSQFNNTQPDLHLGTNLFNKQSSRPHSNRSESPVPVLQKASSPAIIKSTPTPRRKSSRSSLPRSSPPATKEEPSSPSPSAKEQDLEKERQLKKLEEEVQELRQSYGKMETELKQQIERLEKEHKDQKVTKKKEGGGCAVM